MMDFWRFVDPGQLGPELSGSHDMWLTLLGFAIAVIAASVMLPTLDRIREAGPRGRILWNAAGATSMGFGIWGMHFTAMLSFSLPTPIFYDLLTTLVSVLPAIAGCAAALTVLSRPLDKPWHLLLGAAALAVGIGTMHYLGMEAVRSSAVMRYDPLMFCASILIALALAYAALSVHNALRRHFRTYLLPVLVAAVTLGIAVTSMHMAGMKAAHFHVGSELLSEGLSVAPTLLGPSIAVLVALTTGTVLIAELLYARVLQTSQALRDSEAQYRNIIETMLDVLVVADQAGTIRLCNPAVERTFGYQPEELIGQPVAVLMHDDNTDSPGKSVRQYFDAHKFDFPGNGPVREFYGRHKTGRTFPVTLMVNKFSTRKGRFLSAVIRDVTDEIQQQEALIAAKENAEAANRAKGDFLAAMSHEIRTPMNGVLGMAQILQHSDLTEEQHGALGTIIASGDSLLHIIDEILDFSKIEAGHVRIEQRPFAPLHLVGEVTDLLTNSAHDRKLRLIVDVADRVPAQITSDEARLRQVLTNLVGNAIKFTEAGDITINLSFEETAATGTDANSVGWLRCEVHDTGIGISRDKKERVFEQFAQADLSTSRRYGGTGLGLAISKRILELLGGQIGVNSEPGVGSCFWFEVPVQSWQPRPEPVPPNHSEMPRHVLLASDDAVEADRIARYLRWYGYTSEHTDTQQLSDARETDILIVAQSILQAYQAPLDALAAAKKLPRAAIVLRTGGNSADLSGLAPLRLIPLYRPVLPNKLQDILDGITQPAGQPSSATQQEDPTEADRELDLHVLLVEDNPVNQQVAVRMLEKMGCSVEVAQNGQEGVESWRDRRFDLVLMDCHMPELDGYEATRAIRAEEQQLGRVRLPIIGVSANALKDAAQECYDAGMDDYLTKPFKLHDLRSIILERATPTQ